MVQEEQTYSIEIPDNITKYYIKANDTAGNIATSRVFNEKPNLLPPQQVVRECNSSYKNPSVF